MQDEIVTKMVNYVAECIEAALRAQIRSLGFTGNTYDCPGCLNKFHADLGQHKPGCEVLAGLLADREAV